MLLTTLTLFVTAQINVLFVGDRGFHQPVDRLSDVYGELVRAGVAVDYEDDLDVIDLSVLRKFSKSLGFAVPSWIREAIRSISEVCLSMVDSSM